MRRRTSAMPPNEHPSFRRAAPPQASARQERTLFLNWCWARASGPSHELPKRDLALRAHGRSGAEPDASKAATLKTSQ